MMEGDDDEIVMSFIAQIDARRSFLPD